MPADSPHDRINAAPGIMLLAGYRQVTFPLAKPTVLRVSTNYVGGYTTFAARCRPLVSDAWSPSLGAAQQRSQHAADDLPPHRASQRAGGAFGHGLSQTISAPPT